AVRADTHREARAIAEQLARVNREAFAVVGDEHFVERMATADLDATVNRREAFDVRAHALRERVELAERGETGELEQVRRLDAKDALHRQRLAVLRGRLLAILRRVTRRELEPNAERLARPAAHDRDRPDDLVRRAALVLLLRVLDERRDIVGDVERERA